MKKITSLLVTASILLSACVSPYIDPRLPEDIKNHFTSTINNLQGRYEVLDSRNDDAMNYSVIYIIKTENGVNAFLRSGDYYDRLVGENCISPHWTIEKNTKLIICSTPSSKYVSFFVIEQKMVAETIKDGAMLGSLVGFKPLDVASEDYLFSFYSKNGRPSHYLLRKN